MKLRLKIGQNFLTLLSVIILLFASSRSQSQEITISGVVVDEQELPVSFATVGVQNTSSGTVTNKDGRFSLAVAKKSGVWLQVRCVGYKESVTFFNLNEIDKSDLRIQLKIDSNEIDEVAVTGKSETTLVREKAFAIEAISTENLESRNININRLLSQSAGVKVRESGGLGSEFNYSINGMSGRSIRFFVDGIPIERFGSGYSINDFPVTQIERIEVFKGALPSNFATDALGGAVNIIPKVSAENYIDASYSFGSFNTHHAALSLHQLNQKSGLYFNFQGFYNYSDNNYEVWGSGVEIADPETGRAKEIRAERFHDAYRSASVKGGIGTTKLPWADDLRFDFLLVDNKNELQHGTTMAYVYGEAMNTSESLSPSIQYKKNDFIIDKLSASVFAAYTKLTSVTTDTSSRTYNWLGEVIYEHPLNSEMGRGNNGKSLLTLKSDNYFAKGSWRYDTHTNQHFDLTVTWDKLDRVGKDPYTGDRTAVFRENQFTSKYISSLGYTFNLFGEKWHNNIWIKNYNFKVSTVEIQYITDSLGRRPVGIPVENHLNKTGYGYAAKYTLNRMHLLKLSFEQAVRLPDASEILGDGMFVQNNPNLQPEQSFNLNIGYMATGIPVQNNSYLSLQLDGFYRNTNDLILYTVSNSRGDGSYINIGKVRGLGGSVDLTYAIKNFIRLNANATYTDLRDWNQFAQDGINQNQTYKDRLPNTPYLTANGGIDITQGDLFQSEDEVSFYWNIQYVHEFFLRWPSLGDPGTKSTIPTQFVNNTGVSYAFRSGMYSVGLDCSNIFNKQVYDNYLLQKPGRFVSAKFRIFINN